MRPTHIRVTGKAKLAFFDARERIIEGRRFPDLIAQLASPPHARITLSSRVETVDDLRPLLEFLERFGVPPHAIIVDYPAQAGLRKVQEALTGGLRDSELDFGGDVAEKDNGLTRYFVATESYDLIRRHRRHVVVGRKGSGKTAILRELTKDLGAGDENVMVVTPEQYATEVLNTILKDKTAGELAAFTTTWKYTLLIEIFRKVVDSKVGDARAQAELRKYLVDQGHLGTGLTLFERFVRYLQRIKEVKGTVAGTGVSVSTSSAEELGRLFRLDEVLRLIPTLQVILKRNPFHVYVDELDQGWDNSANANSFLIGLLTAAIQINGFDPNLHVVVFIRSEIFDLLKAHLPQLDKLRSDIEILRWDEVGLTNLLARRTLDSLKIEDGKLPAKEVVRELFEGKMQESSIEPMEYIISRTAMRPREIIQMATLALRESVARQLWRIDEEAVLTAEEAFSKWKLEHIVSEHLDIFPGLGAVLERFRGMMKLVEAGVLDARLVQIILEAEKDPRAPVWLRSVPEPEELLKILYQIEVIGVQRIGKREVEHRRPWVGFDFSYTRPDARAEQSAWFLFHPALWKSLELQ
jgi:hypothetical protein